MYIPLSLRLTLFYAFLLGLALWLFGALVYAQAQQRAYTDLDNSLKSRAASVQLGKFLLCDGYTGQTGTLPLILPSVDGLGTGGVSIEVVDQNLTLLATTTGTSNVIDTTVTGLGSSPIPWDAQAAQTLISNSSSISNTPGLFSTITYMGQRVRVYSLLSTTCSIRVIQTARSEQSIEQSLNDLRLLLLQGGSLALILALIGGWLISKGTLSAVQRITRVAQGISASRNFSQRVPVNTQRTQDELARLAMTFNAMLTNLEEAYQRQQRFVADASHELRAPLTSIRCNLDLLTKAPDLPAEEAEAALKDAQAEAERMGRLVSDLLTLAHSDALLLQQAGQQDNSRDGYKKMETVFRQQIDLDSLLLDVFRQYRLHEGKGDTQEQRGPRLLLQHITPVKVRGDADQLKQVLVALLDNAFKYTPEDGQIILSLTTSNDYALLQVSDTGIGISPEDIPHIFERFYRADHTHSREHQGSGLGLAIAYAIMQQHGGSIDVESTPGKGSTFNLKLPVVSE